MIKKNILSITMFCSMLLLSINSFAQRVKSGVILNIEGSKVYVDVTSQSTKVHDVFNVYSECEYFIHPVTKREIKKNQELINKKLEESNLKVEQWTGTKNKKLLLTIQYIGLQEKRDRKLQTLI